MDEQLEVTFEGAGMEDQSETPISPGSEAGPAEEKAEEAVRQEEMNGVATRGESAQPEQKDGEPNKPSPGGQRSGATGVNDLPVAGQSRGVTEPQREGSEADRGIPPRNYYAEWQELAEAHPEVVGKELPEDIYQACMRSELPPLRVYESMMLQKQAEQISALQQEIATLRQNAENTARAPVLAAASGPDSEPEDLFLKGFNSY